MSNRNAFIDFAQGLLNLNPLERWTPSQAKLHPFITQQKFTGPFVPPMTLRQANNKSPAPGVQEQQRAEAVSKQRQQQQQQQAAQAQAQNAAYATMQMQYAQSPMGTPSNNPYHMYTTPQQAPPPYQQQAGYQHQMGAMPPQGQAQRYTMQPNNPYAQGSQRGGRQRSATLEQQQPHQSGIPASLQRVMGHLDPNAPIRLQPSPAYYPPPADGSQDPNARRRGSRAGQRGNRDFIRTLEDRTLEEGFNMNSSSHWQ
jgi:dual specificity protein kinase YAK1